MDDKPETIVLHEDQNAAGACSIALALVLGGSSCCSMW
jgi:hypothetical protein